MDIRLVALDLDDTLLDRKNALSPRVIAAVSRAVARGITVTVATGRMFCSAAPYARQLQLDVPLITYNGAMIRAAISGELIDHQPIERETAQEVMDLVRERGWYIQSYVDDRLYVREINDRAKSYAELSGIEAIALGDAFYTVTEPPTKMLYLARPDEITAIRRTMEERFGSRLSLAESKPHFLELTRAGINKGRSVALLAGRLGLNREQVMAVGDSNNDIDMIRYAGWGVAMGNAPESIRREADAVVAGNDADGAAEAIERFALGEIG